MFELLCEKSARHSIFTILKNNTISNATASVSWNFGHLTFDNTIQQIRAHVGGCIVYIKGHEKFCFLKEHIPNLYKIDAFPSFKSMNNCASDVCDVRHGTNCARRKVHELRFIDMYKA